MKKKLQFDKKNDFVPDKTVVEKIVASSPQFIVCRCCKGRPYDCQGSEFCSLYGKCVCISQGEMEEMIQADGGMEVEGLCSCCFNDFFNCPAILCKQLGMCQCQMREELERRQTGEADDNEGFVVEYSDCSCCRGFVYSCGNQICVLQGACFCIF